MDEQSNYKRNNKLHLIYPMRNQIEQEREDQKNSSDNQVSWKAYFKMHIKNLQGIYHESRIRIQILFLNGKMEINKIDYIYTL